MRRLAPIATVSPACVAVAVATRPPATGATISDHRKYGIRLRACQRCAVRTARNSVYDLDPVGQSRTTVARTAAQAKSRQSEPVVTAAVRAKAVTDRYVREAAGTASRAVQRRGIDQGITRPAGPVKRRDVYDPAVGPASSVERRHVDERATCRTGPIQSRDIDDAAAAAAGAVERRRVDERTALSAGAVEDCGVGDASS